MIDVDECIFIGLFVQAIAELPEELERAPHNGINEFAMDASTGLWRTRIYRALMSSEHSGFVPLRVYSWLT